MKGFIYKITNKVNGQYKAGKTLRALGIIFNVDKQTIKDLLRRNNVTLRTTRTYKLTLEDRQEILEDFKQGLSRKDIQTKWHISKSYLSQLINGYHRI